MTQTDPTTNSLGTTMSQILAFLALTVTLTCAAKSTHGQTPMLLEEEVEIETLPFQRTYFILYRGDTQSPNLVNCTAPPGNFTSGTTHVRWESPSGVNIVSEKSVADGYDHPVQSESNPSDVKVEVEATGERFSDSDGEFPQPPSWVELTSDYLLRFHNPDTSQHGPYTCHGMLEERVVYTNIVWVHVLKKYEFQAGDRLKIGFISAGVFFLFVSICIIATRVYGSHVSKYRMAAREEPFSVQMRPEGKHNNDTANSISVA